ncbi:MAG: ABC transporter permease [Beutenbergiaceae bacterium]
MAAAGSTSTWERIVAPLAVGVLGLLIWQILVGVVGVSAYLLPAPAEIAAEFASNAGPIAEGAVITGSNAAIGLLAGTIIGVLLAGIASRLSVIDAMLAPVVAGLAVIPIVALAPVLNSMFGADSEVGRQIIAAIASFVPIFINTLRGLRQTTPLQRDMMRAYAASSGQVFRILTLPTAAPFLLTGIRLASSLAVISALVAEYFGGPRGGLGSFISTSAATSAYARAWAYVGAAIVLGLALYLLTVLLERTITARLTPSTT